MKAIDTRPYATYTETALLDIIERNCHFTTLMMPGRGFDCSIAVTPKAAGMNTISVLGTRRECLEKAAARLEALAWEGTDEG
jgi:hypothetical protein